jgi:hypothetical protein
LAETRLRFEPCIDDVPRFYDFEEDQ